MNTEVRKLFRRRAWSWVMGMFLLIGVAVPVARAAYNANMTGTPIDVLTYEGGLILFRLDNQPATHPGCNANYFAIDVALGDASVSRLYARLLVAYSQQQAVNVGYDNAAACVSGYIHVYLVG